MVLCYLFEAGNFMTADPIKPPNSVFESRWQWLPLGYKAQYDLWRELTPDQLRELTHLLITQVLPQNFRSARFVTDMRGRDPNLPSLAHFSQPTAALGKEEVLYLHGPIEEAQEAEDTEPESLEFSFQIETAFDHFEGARHIVYDIRRQEVGAAENRHALDLILDPTTKISGIRIGFEIFEPRFLTIFGFSPTPNFLFQLEATPSALALRIACEGLGSPSQILKKGAGVIERMDRVTTDLFCLGLIRDLEARATAKG